MYDRLFTWIVATLNNVIHVERDVTRHGSGSVIGVLDIYGFEIFKDNRCEFSLVTRLLRMARLEVDCVLT